MGYTLSSQLVTNTSSLKNNPIAAVFLVTPSRSEQVFRRAPAAEHGHASC